MTPTLVETFKENPQWFLFALLAGGAAIFLAAVALALGRRRPTLALALVGAALLATLAGVGGVASGSHTKALLDADSAARPGLTERDRTAILGASAAQRAHLMGFGLVAASPGGILAVLALVLAWRRRTPPLP